MGMVDLFQYPTVQTLAAYVAAEGSPADGRERRVARTNDK